MKLSAQSKWEQAAFGVRMNRNDFFEENSIFYKGKTMNHELGLGFGVIKTVFQQRFNPELFYSMTIVVFSKKQFSFHGAVSYNVNCFNSNRMQREVHFFNEFLGGIKLSYGSKWNIFLQAQAGCISESFHSDLLGKTKQALNSSFSAKTGLTYAF